MFWGWTLFLCCNSSIQTFFLFHVFSGFFNFLFLAAYLSQFLKYFFLSIWVLVDLQIYCVIAHYLFACNILLIQGLLDYVIKRSSMWLQKYRIQKYVIFFTPFQNLFVVVKTSIVNYYAQWNLIGSNSSIVLVFLAIFSALSYERYCSLVKL